MATASFFYYRLGPDYLKALAQNEVVLSRDDRQMLEWVGRGKFLGALGPSDVMATELARGGLPVKLQGALKEGTYLTANFGAVIYMDKAPHPNTARVYLNWLLSKEGQTVFSKASGHVSRRLDVSREGIDPELLPKEGVDYYLEHREESEQYKEPTRKLIVELFGK